METFALGATNEQKCDRPTFRTAAPLFLFEDPSGALSG